MPAANSTLGAGAGCKAAITAVVMAAALMSLIDRYMVRRQCDSRKHADGC